MGKRQHELGMTLAEVMVALAIVGIMIFASTVVTTQAHLMTRANSDKEFATQKAISIIEEMKALVQVNANGNITSLDTFDDGANTNPILTIQGTHLEVGDPTVPTQPGDSISGNTALTDVNVPPVTWTYERHITVTTPPNEASANDVRLVDVQIYKNTQTGKLLLSEVSSVIRTIITSLPPSQVYDVYAIAVENVPGWWVYMSNVVQVVRNAITNLEGRNPGLEFRQHWINTLAYGRDQQYMPYVNEASDSRADITSTYFYPGKMPDPALNANVGNNYYYYPSFFRGHVNIDGVSTNGYNNSIMPGEAPIRINPYPYALADQYNHAMRYQDELNLYTLRKNNNPTEEMTLRLLLEDMYTRPDRYANALVINLHGELMPFPPIRNYSDAAKDPETIGPPTNLQNVRVVTHPEQLAYSTTATPTANVNLRIYSYLTNPDAAGALNNLPNTVPICILIKGMAGWTPAAGNITNIAGGLTNAGAAVAYSAAPVATPICGVAPANMCYTTQLVGLTFQDTLIKLYNSPLRAPLDTATGRGIDYGSRLYNMEYIPSPVEDLTVAAPLAPFSRDLTWTSPLPKNTARWVISIPGAAPSPLPANGMLTVETRIGDVCGAGTPTCTGGVLYPVADRPTNLSRTYVYHGNDTYLFGDLTLNPIVPPNLPITERYQFQGDPRHCPYAELKRPFTNTSAVGAPTTPLGMGYNRNFDNFEDTKYNGKTYTQLIGSNAEPFTITNANKTVYLKVNNVNIAASFTVNTGVRTATQIVTDMNANANFAARAVADVVNGHVRIMPLPGTPTQTIQFDTVTGTIFTPLGFDNLIRTGGAWVGWTYTNGVNQYGVKNAGDLLNKGAAGWVTSNGDIDFDVARLFQITRSALIRSNALWTTMTGWSYYYVGIGNEIGYDAANGFPNSVPVSTMPFTGATGSQYVDAITRDTGQGTYLVKGVGAAAGWWSMPWLGELYPDSDYFNGGIDWKTTGNLPSSNATAPSYFVRDLRQNYATFPGTDLEQTVRRTYRMGCTTMFWAGLSAATFHHSGGTSPDTGTIVNAPPTAGGPGQDIQQHFAFPVPDTMDSNRPFGIAENNVGAGLGWLDVQ